MRNINNLSSKAYLFLTVISSLIAMFIYRATIFRCLFLSTFNESKAVLWAIWSTSLIVTYLMTHKSRRNYVSLFTNAVLPFGIYSVMTYENSHAVVVGVIEIAILTFCGLYWLVILIRNVKSDSLTEIMQVYKRRIIHCIKGTKTISAVCLSVLLIYIFGLYAFDLPSLIPAVKPSVSVEENKTEVVKKNMPIISKIDERIWKNLSFENRLDVLQTLANVEKTHLGISHEVNVRANSLGWETYGTYDYTKHEVTINTQIIMEDDSTQAVITLCHELRHAFQHDVVDVYLTIDKDYQQLEIFDEARKYYENLDDYQSAERDGFDEYESQIVEANSRSYSKIRAVYYFCAADKYLADAA